VVKPKVRRQEAESKMKAPAMARNKSEIADSKFEIAQERCQNPFAGRKGEYKAPELKKRC
jgi:hypothetical protein